jgi:hypothetical protein
MITRAKIISKSENKERPDSRCYHDVFNCEVFRMFIQFAFLILVNGINI